jgi:hypothetical protein
LAISAQGVNQTPTFSAYGWVSDYLDLALHSLRSNDLIRRYMEATQNGKPVSLTPFITMTVTDWYDEGKKTMRQAEASIAEYYKAYPVQSTSFDPEEMYVVPLDGKSVNGHSVFEVRVPFTWIAQGRNGAKKSGSSEKIQWVEPKLVCEVAFAEWTEDEELRQTTSQTAG